MTTTLYRAFDAVDRLHLDSGTAPPKRGRRESVSAGQARSGAQSELD